MGIIANTGNLGLVKRGGGGTPATLNPLDKGSSITLSNGDLTASCSGGWGGVRATVGKATGTGGTGSFEVTVGNVIAGNQVYGISTPSYPVNDATLTDYFYNLFIGNGDVRFIFTAGVTTLDNGAIVTSGDVVRVEVDSNNSLFEVFVNNVSRGGQFSMVAGTFYPTIFLNGNGDVATINCGQSAFVNPPTSGIIEGWFV